MPGSKARQSAPSNATRAGTHQPRLADTQDGWGRGQGRGRGHGQGGSGLRGSGPNARVLRFEPDRPPGARLGELELECAAQLRRIGDKLNSIGRAADITAVLAEMPGKKARKSSPQSPSSMRVPADLEAECAQLRRIGDKLNFRQKLLNLISKLFNLIT